MLLAQALVSAAPEADSGIDLEVDNIIPEIPLHKAGQVSDNCSSTFCIAFDRKHRSWVAPTLSGHLTT